MKSANIGISTLSLSVMAAIMKRFIIKGTNEPLGSLMGLRSAVSVVGAHAKHS